MWEIWHSDTQGGMAYGKGRVSQLNLRGKGWEVCATEMMWGYEVFEGGVEFVVICLGHGGGEEQIGGIIWNSVAMIEI